MREILFRGKRVDNGEWITARTIFTIDDGRVYFASGDPGYVDASTINTNNIVFTKFSAVQVDPETIGEYTGVTDKRNNRVFKDDIARVKYEGKTYVGVIQYDALGVFIFVARGFGWVPLYKLADDEMTQRNGQGLTAIEVIVIGNIHDNPELLK